MIRRLASYLWPRTVLGLVLFGFLLVGTPLIAGLLVTSQQIDRLTHAGERSLEQAVSITREARETLDRVRALERAARQLRVLRDEDAVSHFRTRRESVATQLREMASLEMPPSLRATLATLIAGVGLTTEEAVLDYGQAPWPDALARQFSRLDGLARSLVTASQAAADQAVVDLQALGERTRGLVFAQMVAVIPIAVVFALIFTGLITRPIRRLDHSIRGLTQPDAGPIEPVRGPRDLRVLSVRLEWARRRLARIEKDRQRLLGQVSHELKTPLSAISEGVSLMEDELVGPLDPRQAEVVNILKANADRLAQQIESLLRFNRTRAGLEPQTVERLSAAGLVDEVVGAHSLAMAARGLRTERATDTDVAIDGDPDMLRTAVENLVSNAIKFSPQGGRIGCHVQQDGDTVRIRVSDDGPGIPPEDRHRVFEPFYRGRASAAGAVPGSGLGLSICRDLLRAHGGQIELTRVEGWRTAFEIRLPASVEQERNETN